MRLIDADSIPYTMLYKANWITDDGLMIMGVEKQGVWKETIDAQPTFTDEHMGAELMDELRNLSDEEWAMLDNRTKKEVSIPVDWIRDYIQRTDASTHVVSVIDLMIQTFVEEIK